MIKNNEQNVAGRRWLWRKSAIGGAIGDRQAMVAYHEVDGGGGGGKIEGGHRS